ncbi:OsmC family peroxiredoxin [Rhodococcoides kyotonense]|uniref:Osmotically inducible protein OsmC n=1 Tax=Rhodococcoides kyotonense TaxID=398843 RepID=A0A239IVM1_9NOCA|nr:OsmC family peroxiredoxin [Rhodococcus kyotonensis]SNS96474.1 osmotically inducible protein OsmC [Rhodococcus kyotonensis]
MIARGSSTWSGDWHRGSGTIATSRPTVPPTPFSYGSRFDDEAGASPEELFAAAYAGCLNQAVANVLGWGNFVAESIETAVEFEVELGVRGGQPGTVRIALKAVVPGIRSDQFAALTTVARDGCLLSRMLRDTPEMTAELVGASE